MKKIRSLGCGVGLVLLGAVGLAGIYVAVLIFVLPDGSDVGEELSRMARQDQAVRQAGFAEPVAMARLLVGDWIRVNRVRRIVAADLLSTAQDHANAARILQHGVRASDYRTAQALSLVAYELGEEEMLRHSALAEDRYLLAIGEPQKYGSQFICDPQDGWQLSPIDPSVTDEERARMQMEPLATMEDKLDELNRVTGGQCTFTRETMQWIETIMDDGP